MQKLMLAFLFLPLMVLSQDSTTIFIPAGKSLSEVVYKKKIYQYPDFMDGEILFRDGSLTKAKLNYNFLNGEIEFLSPKGDTLAIAKPQMLNIKQVTLDSHFYYVNEGYLMQVLVTPNGRLLKRQQYKILKKEKIGGYEQPSSTSAIESYSSFTIDGQFQPDLKIKQNVTLVRTTEYYFGDQYSNFLRANKKNAVKSFPKQKETIENYLKTTNIDFKKEEDLKGLLLALK